MTIIKEVTLRGITGAFSGSDTGHSCYFASGSGLQSGKWEKCGTRISNSRRVCSKEQLMVRGTGEPQKEGLRWDSCSQTMSCTFNLFFF